MKVLKSHAFCKMAWLGLVATCPIYALPSAQPQRHLDMEKKVAQIEAKVQSLIGIQTVGGEFPGGWKTLELSALGTGKNYAMLSNGSIKALVLASDDTWGGVNRKKITAAMPLQGRSRESDWHSLVTTCSDSNFVKTKSADAAKIVIAEVIFKKCARYSTRVPSAWLVDLTSNTLTAWPTKGMRCSNSFLDSGEFSECKYIPKE